MDRKRRSLLSFVLLSGWLALAGSLCPPDAVAKDGGSSGGSGGSGSSGSSDGGGSGRSGSNSGSGHGGQDDHGGDDRGDDNGDDHNRNGHNSDSDRARDAVRDGKVMPLKAVLQKIDMARYGRVIDVRLNRSMFSDTYQLKVRDGAGTIRTLRIDARNGALPGGN